MAETIEGKIIEAKYGYGPKRLDEKLYYSLFGADQLEGEYVWGLSVFLSTAQFTTMDFLGVTLNDYPISLGSFVKAHHTRGVDVANVLTDAGKRTIDELVGVKVLVTHEDGKLVGWKVMQ